MILNRFFKTKGYTWGDMAQSAAKGIPFGLAVYVADTASFAQPVTGPWHVLGDVTGTVAAIAVPLAAAFLNNARRALTYRYTVTGAMGGLDTDWRDDTIRSGVMAAGSLLAYGALTAIPHL